MIPRTSHRPQQDLLRLATAACRQQGQTRLPRNRIPNRCPALIQAQPSPRWPHQRHDFSTSPRHRQQPPPQEPFPTYFQDAPPPPPPKPKRPVLRRVLFATTFLLLGNLLGGVLERFVNPEPPSAGDPKADSLQRDRIRYLASKLPVVQALEEDPDWVSWDAYEAAPPEQRRTHLVASTLASPAALGAYQRVFQNTETGEVLVLVYFGRGVTGWPTVVHGGALATVLDETCGRAAITWLARNSAGGVEGSRRPVFTAWLKLDYLAMTQEREFYLVGARVKDDEELEEGERGKRDYKAYVEGWVESVRTGEPTVVAEALFVGQKPRKGEKAGVDAEARADGPPILPPDQRW